jgi:predicted helicase
MAYREVYEDWSYLFNTISYADDMTGGYVDSEDLEELLKNPSKATAKNCLNRQIDYWFYAGVEYSTGHKDKSIYDLVEEFPKISEIADRYFKELSDCPNPFTKTQ